MQLCLFVDSELCGLSGTQCLIYLLFPPLQFMDLVISYTCLKVFSPRIQSYTTQMYQLATFCLAEGDIEIYVITGTVFIKSSAQAVTVLIM